MAYLPGQSTLLSTEEQEILRDSLGQISFTLEAGDSSVIKPLLVLLDDQRLTIQKHYFGQDTVMVSQLAEKVFFRSTYLEGLTWGEPINGTMLRNYWRDTSRRIVFSPLLGQFTDVPPGTRAVRHELQPAPLPNGKAEQLADYRSRIARAVAQKDFYLPVELIPEIGELGTSEAFEYLKECAAGQHWGKSESPRHNQIMGAIIKGLAHHQSLEAAQLVLELTRRLEGWGNNGFIESMNWITGIHLEAGPWADQDSLVEEYQRILDSLPSLHALQTLGLQRADPARPEDFSDRGAYLEHLIVRPGQKDFVLFHALRELEALHDPRVLVHLAALPLHENIFSSRGLTRASRGRLEGLTGVRLLVENDQGELVADANKRVKFRNALHYWVKHYGEYAWSDSMGRFVYQGNNVMPLDTVAVWIERLYQKDAAAAVRAVEKLIHLPVDTLQERLKGRHFTALHGANKALPFSLKTKLPAFAEVLAICRALEYPTRLSKLAEDQLERLASAANDADRNKILSTLNVPTKESVTALEVWGYVHARRYSDAVEALNDWLNDWYVEQWKTKAISGEDLRLYLLKSALHRRGSFRGIWQKFETIIQGAGPGALYTLKVLGEKETDERISKEVTGILVRDQVRRQDHFSVAEYLDFGALGAPVPVEQVVVELTPGALRSLFDRFADSSKELRYRLIQVVDHHRDIAMVPYLLNLASDTTIVENSFVSFRTDEGRFTEHYSLRQGDYMVSILEKLYGIYFKEGMEEGPPEELVIRNDGLQHLRLRDKWQQAQRWRAWLKE